MQYIYESPDKGKTIYRTPVGHPNVKRELVIPDNISIDISDEGIVVLTETKREN